MNNAQRWMEQASIRQDVLNVLRRISDVYKHERPNISEQDLIEYVSATLACLLKLKG